MLCVYAIFSLIAVVTSYTGNLSTNLLRKTESNLYVFKKVVYQALKLLRLKSLRCCFDFLLSFFACPGM